MSMIEDRIVTEHEPAPVVEAESELRDKNQITVPKPVVDALAAQPGDRFVWIVEDGERGVVHLHRLQDSYAGSLAGVYGRPDEVEKYLAAEREAWGE
jgi:bifunctional DNA-binding transcriptional regulator/antitoxin component of YhaV-PrlF toxin-antitoxin module